MAETLCASQNFRMFSMQLKIVVAVTLLLAFLARQNSCNGLMVPSDYKLGISNGILERSKREPQPYFDPEWVAESARILGHKLDTEKYKKKLKSHPPRHRLTINKPED